ncbi:MAG TPA: phosphoribosylamine--glycine ligase [Nocardioidaceae bacterium]|nr:phosphoribosylamine--glycine ligase [Nocardioidaceae bacterium]
MRVLVVGGGGREHALVKALRCDPEVGELHAAPGNPGIAELAGVHGVDVLDGPAVAGLARRLTADLVVIGPEAPLVAGVADAVRSAELACFGPSKAAARIEGSKAYAKEVMAAAGIATARARVCDSPAEASAALDQLGPPYVVKDDGLAAGKGVVVTSDRTAAERHAASCGRVVVEEFLDGPEVSVFGITDGRTVLAMEPAQDFKRLGDGDVGPNTGGMGAYAPLPWAKDDLAEEVRQRVLQPCVDELRRRGTPFTGLLYAGVALTGTGTKVVEFNARFGDPETQVLLELLTTPLGGLLAAAATGRLADFGPLSWRTGAAVAVVLAARGYPARPLTGDPVTGVDEARATPGVDVLHAGTALRDGSLVTSGGRVLAVTGVGTTVDEARTAAYRGVGRIDFPGAQFRSDIAAAAAAMEAAAARPGR